jgi:transposase
LYLQSMATKKPSSPAKRDSLRREGALNPHPQTVTDLLFQGSDFFDRDDLIQVKYEMLRRVEIDKQPVSQAASAFGLSRPTFYQAQSGFAENGLAGLLPQKRGPRHPHKLTVEVLGFISQARAEDPALLLDAMVKAVRERFGVTVHPRSIERALARQEKKRR